MNAPAQDPKSLRRMRSEGAHAVAREMDERLALRTREAKCPGTLIEALSPQAADVVNEVSGAAIRVHGVICTN